MLILNRKLHEVLKSNTDETHLLQYVGIFTQALWPGGNRKPPNIPRTNEEKSKTRDDANRKLTTLMPGTISLANVLLYLTVIVDLAANMIGRSNARRGARRMFAVLQNRRLNQHLVYTVFDEASRLLSGSFLCFL